MERGAGDPQEVLYGGEEALESVCCLGSSLGAAVLCCYNGQIAQFLWAQFSHL